MVASTHCRTDALEDANIGAVEAVKLKIHQRQLAKIVVLTFMQCDRAIAKLHLVADISIGAN